MLLRRLLLPHTRQLMKRTNSGSSKPEKIVPNKQLRPTMAGLASRVRDNPAFLKIDTPEFRSIFTDELRALILIFRKYNYELRIAGGAVRDILMEIKPKDIDLATTATPDEMKAMFTAESVRMINAKGEKHGTITPRIHDKENFEVTTLRIDVLTDGRHAEVQFTTDWQLDANRRDLTINSMYLNFDGMLFDYFYGYEDLLKQRVVFVGDPAVRIKEDYLRILRYFRFYGRIAKEANKHDAATLVVISENADGLARISGERIWTELHKIVVGKFGLEMVEEMIKCGLAPHCGLPMSPNLPEFQRLHAALDGVEGPHHPILFMIALLHTHYDALHLHERLKLSAFERDLAIFITQQRSKVDQEYKTLLDYQKLCLQPFARRDYVEELLKYCNKRELYAALKSWERPQFPLNGNRLQEHGCPCGKKMGIVMSQLKLIWADSNFKLTDVELLDTHLPAVLVRVMSPTDTPTKKHLKSN